MMTFGYNNRFSGPLRALLFVVLGILLIVAKADAMELVVKIVAAFVLATGLVSFAVGFRRKSDGAMPLSVVNALVNVCIAVLLFLFAGSVAKFISYLLGFVLFGFGAFQIIVFFSARKNISIGFGAYVLPVLVMLVGLVMLFYPSLFGQSLGLVSGIALIAYGVSELIAAFKVKAAMDSSEEDVDEQ